ncbi:alpha/beta fold hydrolase [Aegicerativicinus sediminis]|uniref:alpha/beta fold hydrolase n=1 Tax=Aegicerativicinus sediminis TaxID=2893202 RepID=UPI001E37C666|nr:alpha/beta hydrolase [Aegicerativicinus sediminis]
MTINFKGAEIHYWVHGEGPALVFLHGFLEDMSIWKDLSETLTSKYKVILIDLLGHGDTGSVADVHTMDLMAEAVLALLEGLTIKEAIVLGHSMGGYVTLAFADNYPEKVRGICLINSTALEDNASKKVDRDRAAEAVKKDMPLFLSIAIPILFSESNRFKYASRIAELQSHALNMSVENVVAAIIGMKNRPNRVHVLDRFKSRSFVILGKEDSILSADIQREYLERLNVDFSLLEGGHMGFIEEKKEITYKIMQFIEKL